MKKFLISRSLCHLKRSARGASSGRCQLTWKLFLPAIVLTLILLACSYSPLNNPVSAKQNFHLGGVVESEKHNRERHFLLGNCLRFVKTISASTHLNLRRGHKATHFLDNHLTKSIMKFRWRFGDAMLSACLYCTWLARRQTKVRAFNFSADLKTFGVMAQTRMIRGGGTRQSE